MSPLEQPPVENDIGALITFEGGEGSGKSTQSRVLAERLREAGFDVVHTREPGGTDLGVDIRKMLLDRDRAPMSRKAQFFGFMMDRTEHVEQVIAPALKAKKIVICDRFSASTLVYQGLVGGLDVDMIMAVDHWATSTIVPDWTFFLDIDPEIGLERARRVERTRFEDEAVEYHRRIRAGFQLLALNNPNWTIVNAENTVSYLSNQIFNRVYTVLKNYHRPIFRRALQHHSELNTP